MGRRITFMFVQFLSGVASTLSSSSAAVNDSSIIHSNTSNSFPSSTSVGDTFSASNVTVFPSSSFVSETPGTTLPSNVFESVSSEAKSEGSLNQLFTTAHVQPTSGVDQSTTLSDSGVQSSKVLEATSSQASDYIANTTALTAESSPTLSASSMGSENSSPVSPTSNVSIANLLSDSATSGPTDFTTTHILLTSLNSHSTTELTLNENMTMNNQTITEINATESISHMSATSTRDSSVIIPKSVDHISGTNVNTPSVTSLKAVVTSSQAVFTSLLAAVKSSTQSEVAPSSQAIVTQLSQEVVVQSSETVVTPSSHVIVTPLSQTVATPLSQAVVTPSSQAVVTQSWLAEETTSIQVGSTSSLANIVSQPTLSVAQMTSPLSTQPILQSFFSLTQKISQQDMNVTPTSSNIFHHVQSTSTVTKDVFSEVSSENRSVHQMETSTDHLIYPTPSSVSTEVTSNRGSSVKSTFIQQPSITMSSDLELSDHVTTVNYTDSLTISDSYPNRYDFLYVIELTGECELLENKDALTEIWASLLSFIKHESKSGEKIEPIKLLCEPLRLSFKVKGSTRKNLTEILETRIKKEKLNITLLIDNSKTVLQAKRIYFYIEDEYDSELFLMGLNEVDIIVIICATAISLILVCAGLIICAREYYLKKRTRSFTLSSYVSKGSSSYDYTLTKIPRSNGAYTENGVRMKPLTDSDSPKNALLPIEEQETSVSDFHIRVNSNDSGIIVGVTGTGSGSQNLESRDTSENGDQAGEKLVEKKEESDKSVDNPIYFADDDRFSNV